MPVPIQRLQRADRLLGAPAFVLLQPARWLRRRKAGPARRVLLVKFWGLGSLQLLTPAVQSLRARHPGAQLELLTLSSNGPFASGLGLFDRIRTLDLDGGWAAITRRILALVVELRRAGHDVVYDFEFFTRFSAVLSCLSGAPESHGFAHPGSLRAGLHTRTIDYGREWHVARNFRALAEGENGREVTAGDVVPLKISSEMRAEAAALLFERGRLDGPLVVLNPNAGDLSLERRWPPERFAELARRMITEDAAQVVVTGTRAERERVAAIVRRVGTVPAGTLVDAAGALSIGGLAALFEGADLVVTNDSGPMHVAAALGTPTLALFGPETPRMYHPLGIRTRVLYRPPICSPCINVHQNKLSVCWRGQALCMTNLGVDEVWEAARQELRSRSPLRAEEPA